MTRLSEVGSWLSTHLPLISTVVVALATVFLVWLTARYVRLTSRLLEEAQRSREPAVTIDFELPDDSLRLVVFNHGLSPARKIRFNVLKDVDWIEADKDNRGLSGFGPIRNGISYLTPSRKLKYYLGSPDWSDAPREAMEISVQISYENEASKHFESVVDFNLEHMRDVLFESFKEPGLAVAEAIRETERRRQSHDSSRRMFSDLFVRRQKACPSCAEMIPYEAKKCSHCLEPIHDT